MNEKLSVETQQIVNGVDERFFVIQKDGSIASRNAHNKLQGFCYARATTAQTHAARQGARVYDKLLSKFI